ncbi:MAG TPA: bifunctional [glutamine synthetase] adenylyltransferase/[glutamine synthetase]-adenylyl-L-tyrosine phosphorylase [Rhodopila sp.]|uniref:bifunctional [glutamine synthetase] adenylyltransferase/[glutamine synthetase]-adenylyl-L-tyrosine phosphorylase n=1 Tax=Rhodopila sp. TaxID=2480087 RepID=UPI002C2AA5ED|nr:bifunctional [glutamine synthetase] adenylyltransferase/[glutamine synthetase]-adenylyl-L-tyrosine phosphorylase [Rhodopila sp.]HVY15966.1 bifunctional [glutamine synthetase] adenylyltransferase/[glutamine synthetase]-adenylyl-L-tyrosine phosphorylase [Rhodopila sp.]
MAAAERTVERVSQRWTGAVDILCDPGALRLLRAIGGNSPYLSELAIREFATLRTFLDLGPDATLRSILAGLDTTPTTQPRPAIAALLRQAKRKAALAIALADIGGLWTIEQVTETLTVLAEKTLGLAVRHLLRAAHDKGTIALTTPDHPDRNSGFVALGMGKLGGRELNYSSDIDLILIYDAAAAPFAQTEGIGSVTARLARDLIGLMDARDADGYVFRTDLRLRPDPSATPPAVSFLGALSYYESMGQNWERAAMIKARPVAGDLALGNRFLAAIRPFVWRRGLDFAAVADIHALKRRINAHRNTALSDKTDPVSRLLGYNVKLGEGGIRDIEFLIQTLQIVWGGRDPSLRLKSTMAAGERLVETGHLDASAFARLINAYRFFRMVEHRLQMINDRQTHELSGTPEGLAAVAIFLGFSDASAFAGALIRHIDVVRAHYRQVFESVPETAESAGDGPELDFRGDHPEPIETVAALKAMGFTDPIRVVAAVRRWLAGHVRALRSSRARDLMTLMVPQVLATLARQTQPDEAFSRFDRFIGALPTGVQPMSLFHRNPVLLERVAQVLGAAPILSEHLVRNPAALEGMLAGESAHDAQRMIQRLLRDTPRLEDVIQQVRRRVKERDFLISVATLDGQLDADAAGRERSALAHSALRVLLPRVLADFESRHGRVPGGELAVVVLGKAGSLEMMAGSDLDLMFIYDHPTDVTESDGARPMSPGQWFVRAVQACVGALTAPGVEGPMYALDMRLRPSGNKGPLAVSLSAFERYHQNGDAWTWERMALTRARVVAGPPALRARVKAAIRQALCRPREATQVRADAASMRARMAKELRPHGLWDVKHRQGGMVDVEFIAQVLQLIHVGAPAFHPDQAGKVALRRLADAGLMCGQDAETLIRADLLWRTVQGVLRLTVGQTGKDALPQASAEPLLKAAAKAGFQTIDSSSLLRKSDEMAQQVRYLFRHYIEGASA